MWGKMDELRAQGRCFNCQETGHEQRNCPKLSSMRPPKPAVRTGAVNLTKMDKLAAKKEKADVFLGNVSMMEHDLIAEELQEFKEVELRVHRLCEEAWGEDPLWYTEETRADCRWDVVADNEEVTIADFKNGGNRTFPREALENPEFCVTTLFANPKTSRPEPAREGGYPLIENYN